MTFKILLKQSKNNEKHFQREFIFIKNISLWYNELILSVSKKMEFAVAY